MHGLPEKNRKPRKFLSLPFHLFRLHKTVFLENSSVRKYGYKGEVFMGTGTV